MDLEDIANDLKLGTDELIAELERIVSSGTRVNLRYMLLDLMDEDSLQELMDFYRATDDAGWSAAEQEFGDVYAEAELRLVHVQFLSEFAN
jgi:ATP-dependent DNA helicase RecQ